MVSSPAARIASVTWPPRVVAAPSSSSARVVRARRGTASAGRPTSVVRIGGTAVVGMTRAGEGGGTVAPRYPPHPIPPATARAAPATPPCSLVLQLRLHEHEPAAPVAGLSDSLVR